MSKRTALNGIFMLGSWVADDWVEEEETDGEGNEEEQQKILGLGQKCRFR
jgi:hypothetical protein